MSETVFPSVPYTASLMQADNYSSRYAHVYFTTLTTRTPQKTIKPIPITSFLFTTKTKGSCFHLTLTSFK